MAAIRSSTTPFRATRAEYEPHGVHTEIHIRAPSAVVFGLAAAVEHWPVLLPHYRSVKVIRSDGPRRLVHMAAHRDSVPVRWTSIQVLHPEQDRIEYLHVAGITRGMEVAWVLWPTDSGVWVRISHRFHPRWPLIPSVLVDWVVHRFFVNAIATKTLLYIRRLAEAPTST